MDWSLILTKIKETLKSQLTEKGSKRIFQLMQEIWFRFSRWFRKSERGGCLYLSVVPITFSRITPKKFRRLFKNEVNLKICPKITSFNFSLDKWFLKPNFPSVFHSQVIAQEKCFPSGKFRAILATQRKLQVTRKG